MSKRWCETYGEERPSKMYKKIFIMGDEGMIIAIDFDGTIVEHEYPKIGRPVKWADETILELIKKGHKIILYTMRGGKYLDEAVNYCKDLGIEFYGVNHNPDQDSWTTSPKAYANFYIDDAAIGCPLIHSLYKRPYVDWISVREWLIENDIL